MTETSYPAVPKPNSSLRFSRFGSYRKDHEVASCAERHKHIHLNDYNYYSNEYCVHGGHSGPADAHLCRDFFNAILMRCGTRLTGMLGKGSALRMLSTCPTPEQWQTE